MRNLSTIIQLNISRNIRLIWHTTAACPCSNHRVDKHDIPDFIVCFVSGIKTGCYPLCALPGVAT